MIEVNVRIYVFTATSKHKTIYKDVNGLFHTQKEADKFLKRELNEVMKLNQEDIDIQIKYYNTSNDWKDDWGN